MKNRLTQILLTVLVVAAGLSPLLKGMGETYTTATGQSLSRVAVASAVLLIFIAVMKRFVVDRIRSPAKSRTEVSRHYFFDVVCFAVPVIVLAAVALNYLYSMLPSYGFHLASQARVGITLVCIVALLIALELRPPHNR